VPPVNQVLTAYLRRDWVSWKCTCRFKAKNASALGKPIILFLGCAVLPTALSNVHTDVGFDVLTAAVMKKRQLFILKLMFLVNYKRFL
jgi:hypothetical protein